MWVTVGELAVVIARAVLAGIGVLLVACVLAAPIAGCGGEQSDRLPTPSPTLPVRADQSVWLVHDLGAVLASSDGGATWDTQSGSIPGLKTAITFSDQLHGWVVGFGAGGRTVAATVDGGAIWRSSATWSGGGRAILDIASTDAEHVWVVGGASPGPAGRPFIRATSDGGTTWQEQSLHARVDLSGVAFVDSRHGWVVGYDEDVDDPTRSFVYATGDGGATWRQQYRSPQDVQLHSVAFGDAKHGWAVGSSLRGDESGVLLGTSDGGATWEPPDPPASLPGLFSVACIDAMRAWIVGADGFVLATADGGKTWRLQESGTNALLTRVAFTDAENGWILAPRNLLLATRDGGVTWTSVHLGEKVAYSDIAAQKAAR